ncbi:MAG: hypothetical protein GY861_05760 [bacterium]|nr:hypothetical protein [bacterium]
MNADLPEYITKAMLDSGEIVSYDLAQNLDAIISTNTHEHFVEIGMGRVHSVNGVQQLGNTRLRFFRRRSPLRYTELSSYTVYKRRRAQ